jgi:hypothetical protein
MVRNRRVEPERVQPPAFGKEKKIQKMNTHSIRI